MKKTFIFITLLFISTFLWCQNLELKAVKQFSNTKEFKIVHDYQLDPYNGVTGNRMFCDNNGSIFIYNDDKNILYELDSKTFQIAKSYSYDFSDIYYDSKLFGLYAVSNNYFFYKWTDAASIAIDRSSGKRKYVVNANSQVSSQLSYYDDEIDILFFQDHNNKIHCIVHPSLEENQNQKNFHNAEETRELLNNGNYAPHLTLDSDNDLYIDGVRCRWNATAYETTDYVITLNNKRKTIRIFDRKESEVLNYTIPENETEESITYHPNGDWYFLTINWTTDTHTLWRIENTWDSQWREQWNKEHINFDNQDSASSTNVAVSKVMTCNDNLRLRSQEATSSKVITTMQKGTKVKILKLGKAETIDGINSNWVQVEVLSDAKNKDGKEIKSGTIGWCYGGYLE